MMLFSATESKQRQSLYAAHLDRFLYLSSHSDGDWAGGTLECIMTTCISDSNINRGLGKSKFDGIL